MEIRTLLCRRHLACGPQQSSGSKSTASWINPSGDLHSSILDTGTGVGAGAAAAAIYATGYSSKSVHRKGMRHRTGVFGCQPSTLHATHASLPSLHAEIWNALKTRKLRRSSLWYQHQALLHSGPRTMQGTPSLPGIRLRADAAVVLPLLPATGLLEGTSTP
jgi:hypothetical protein